MILAQQIFPREIGEEPKEPRDRERRHTSFRSICRARLSERRHVYTHTQTHSHHRKRFTHVSFTTRTRRARICTRRENLTVTTHSLFRLHPPFLSPRARECRPAEQRRDATRDGRERVLQGCACTAGFRGTGRSISRVRVDKRGHGRGRLRLDYALSADRCR